MSGFGGWLDQTFFTIGGTRFTLGGLLLLALIAAATLAASWILQRLVARASRLIGVELTRFRGHPRRGEHGCHGATEA